MASDGMKKERLEGGPEYPGSHCAGRRNGGMGSAARRALVLSLAALLLILPALLLGGCADSDGDDETTTSTTTEETSTTTGEDAGDSDVVTELQPPKDRENGGDSADEGDSDGGSTSDGADLDQADGDGSSDRRINVGGKSPEEYEEELSTLEARARENPDDLEVLQDLAVAQYQTGRYEEAADTYEKMISIEDRAVFHNNLGNVLRDADEIEDAKQEYREAISIDPALVVAYVNLAAVLVSEDSVEEAIEVLSDGISEVEGEDRERLEDYMSQLREQLE